MRPRGTLRPRRTFSKNGITSSGRSGPPKEASRMASAGLVIQRLKQFGQGDCDGRILGAQDTVFGFVSGCRSVHDGAPAHAIFRQEDFDGDEGWRAGYGI